MSSRTYMLAVDSIEPIKNAVGSKDDALLNAVLKSLEEDDEEFAAYARAMIAGDRPAAEPGCWNYLVKPLAEHLGLNPEYLPLDDWKHYYVWEDYRSVANDSVSDQAKTLLHFLEAGRPFQGTEIDHDGCMYAWLTADEVKMLLAELEPLDAEQFGEADEFHEELVEAFQAAVNRNAAVFSAAS